MIAQQHGHSQCRLQIVRTAALIALIALGLALPGCSLFGILSEAATGGKKQPARYTLTPRKTLVMVDDPKNLFAQGNLVRTVGANVLFHVKQNTELTDAHLLPMDRLAKVEQSLGSAYPRTSIAAIGRQAGAKQVIHVRLNEMQLQYGGTIYRPTATSEVKVIEAQTGKRLFPRDDNRIAGLSPQGSRVQSQLPQRHVERREGSRLLMQRELAKRIGRDVARVFYAWQTQPAGHQLNEHR